MIRTWKPHKAHPFPKLPWMVVFYQSNRKQVKADTLPIALISKAIENRTWKETVLLSGETDSCSIRSCTDFKEAFARRKNTAHCSLKAALLPHEDLALEVPLFVCSVCMINRGERKEA